MCLQLHKLSAAEWESDPKSPEAQSLNLKNIATLAFCTKLLMGLKIILPFGVSVNIQQSEKMRLATKSGKTSTPRPVLSLVHLLSTKHHRTV